MKQRADWLLPAALIALSAVPTAAGIVRLLQIGGGGEITPENARFIEGAVSAGLHIVSSILFGVLGALQFAARFRRRRPAWHRRVGRFLTACGLTASGSGLWMTVTYPFAPGDGELLYSFRLLFGALMVSCLILGFTAIRRKDVARHRAWMTRGYAIGMGAGTQVLVHLPWLLHLGGHLGETGRALLLGSGWAINLAVAEWSIRRTVAQPVRPPVAA